MAQGGLFRESGRPENQKERRGDEKAEAGEVWLLALKMRRGRQPRDVGVSGSWREQKQILPWSVREEPALPTP